MEKSFIKMCFILLVFTQKSISQRLKSVTRKTHELDLDKFIFEENCDGVCLGTGGYQLGRCACSCQQEAVFLVSQRKCDIFQQGNDTHCVKRARIQSFSGPYFLVFTPNAGNNGPECFEYGHFSRNDIVLAILRNKID